MGSSLKRKHTSTSNSSRFNKKRGSSSSSPTNGNMTNVSLVKKCAKVVNYLVSFQECAPFLVPHHARIAQDTTPVKVKRPMDFTTLERNLYSQRYYTTFDQFEMDLALIWTNILNHTTTLHPLYKKAMALRNHYEQMNNRQQDGLSRPSLPVELAPPRSSSSSPPTNGENSAFYMTMAVFPQDTNMAQQLDGFTETHQALYNDLNGPLLRCLERQQQPLARNSPYPRLYISKNRSTLKEAAAKTTSSSSTTFAILWHTRIEPHQRHYRLLTTNVTLAQPVGMAHDLLFPTTMDDDDDSYTPKAWVKINPHTITTHYGVQLVVSRSMDHLYFQRAYTTYRVLLHNTMTAAATTTTLEQDRLIDCLSTGQPQLSLPLAQGKQEQETTDTTTTVLNMMQQDDATTTDEDDTPKDTMTTTDSSKTPPLVGEQDDAMAAYREHAAILFDDLKDYAISKGVPIVNVKKYLVHTTAYANAEGYFKQVRYVKNNKDVVVQTFRRMTTSQRAVELVSLLKLKGLAHMADIIEVLETTTSTDTATTVMSGLSMKRYQRTLKQYTHAHTHHRLTAHQKMDLIRQMLVSLQVIHENGIAHRDLSEVNFMVDENPAKILDDGSVGANVYLIDFGKAVLIQPQDVRQWWIEPVPASSTTTTCDGGDPLVDQSGSSQQEDYEGEVIPKTRLDLDQWCQNLPCVYVKPDHGYRCYRSIQTLPRSRADHDVLPWLVDPVAEDMYSIGCLIWKVFAETEPWHGILDSDLKGLRERVEDDECIETQIKKEVAGDVSRQLLLLCLKTQPQDRASAKELLDWINDGDHTTKLLEEWTMYAPTQRKRRHKKSTFRFEEEQAKIQQQQLNKRLNKRQHQKQRQVEEKEAVKVERQRKKEENRVRQQLQKQQKEQQKLHKQQYQQLQQQQQQYYMSFGYPPPPPPNGFYGYPYPPPPPGYTTPPPGYPPAPPVFLPFTQPGGAMYPFYPPPPLMQPPPPLNGSDVRPPPPPPSSLNGDPPLPISYIPTASSSSPSHIRFKDPVTNYAIPTTTTTGNSLPQNPYTTMVSRPLSNVRQDQPPSSSTTSQRHVLLPSPTSPKRYVRTGRPVGRPKGSKNKKNKLKEQRQHAVDLISSSSEYEP